MADSRPRGTRDAIAFSVDGRRALSAGYHGGILLWDLALASHRLFRPIGPHAYDAWVGGFLDAESALVAKAGVVFRLDLAGGSILWRQTVDHPEEFADLPEGVRKRAETQAARGREVLIFMGSRVSYATSSDVHSIVYTAKNFRAPHSVHFLSSPGKEAVKIADLALPAKLILFAQNDNAILVADNQGHTTVYDRHGAVLGQTRQHPVISSWCLSDDGNVVAGDRLGGIHRIELPGVANTRLCEPERCESTEATAMASIPGNRVLAGREDGSFVLIDLATRSISKRWAAAMGIVAATFRITTTLWRSSAPAGRALRRIHRTRIGRPRLHSSGRTTRRHAPDRPKLS